MVSFSEAPGFPGFLSCSEADECSWLNMINLAYHAIPRVLLCMSQSSPGTRAGTTVSIDNLCSLHALSAKREARQGKEVWKDP